MQTEKQVFEGTFYNKALWNNLPEIHNRGPQPIKFFISSVIFLNTEQFVKIQLSVNLIIIVGSYYPIQSHLTFSSY